jgi:hypothetical protein
LFRIQKKIMRIVMIGGVRESSRCNKELFWILMQNILILKILHIWLQTLISIVRIKFKVIYWCRI